LSCGAEGKNNERRDKNWGRKEDRVELEKRKRNKWGTKSSIRYLNVETGYPLVDEVRG
jgi:hypothetical protein